MHGAIEDINDKYRKEGYDAGLAAAHASQWVEITGPESLPEEDCLCFWTTKRGDVEEWWYYVESDTRDYALQTCIAYIVKTTPAPFTTPEPQEKCETNFQVGDVVEKFASSGPAFATTSVAKVRAKTIVTADGGIWTLDGLWWDGRRSWPFPSIRKKEKKYENL